MSINLYETPTQWATRLSNMGAIFEQYDPDYDEWYGLEAAKVERFIRSISEPVFIDVKFPDGKRGTAIALYQGGPMTNGDWLMDMSIPKQYFDEIESLLDPKPI